jgi:hypothetical protein
MGRRFEFKQDFTITLLSGWFARGWAIDIDPSQQIDLLASFQASFL